MADVAAQGIYRTAVVANDLVVTAGITPRVDGRLVWRGKVGIDCSVEEARAAAALAATNALSVAEGVVPAGRHLTQCLSLTVYINASNDFEDHARVADAASEVIEDRLGTQGRGARSAIGVSSLPGGATVEVQLTVKMADTG
ncbi:RidA family protein [Microbacterium sp. RD1]|uniref:RidA family protein n=1 Tax=Microbacterium sp. RD1 TaxID=3457313 RepID=UPI003FA5F3DE